MKLWRGTDRLRGLRVEGISGSGWASGCSASSRSAGVRIQQPAEAGGADDFVRGGCVVHRRWYIPTGREVVAGGVRSFGVVPVLGCGQDVVEVAFASDDQRIQNLGLNRLYYAFNMRPQVRRARGHFGNRDTCLAEDFIEGGRVFHVVVSLKDRQREIGDHVRA